MIVMHSQVSLKRVRKVVATAILVVIAASVIFGLAKPEDDKFSGDVLLFPAELNSLINDNVKDKNEDFLKGFSPFWLSDTIDVESKKSIVSAANEILDILPDDKSFILNYVKLIAKFYRNQYAQSQYSNWFGYLENKLHEKALKANSFYSLVKLTEAIIDSSTISINTSHHWKVYPRNGYIFKGDGVLKVRFKTPILLVCHNNRKDSIIVKEAEGEVDLLNQIWHGRKGKTTWFRAGFDDEKVYASYNHHLINLSQNEFSVDSAQLYYPEYFKKPVLGRLTDKVTPIYRDGQVDYPQFNPYKKIFEIKNIFPRIDYAGNFQIKGSRMEGIGPDGSLAKVTIKRNGKPFMTSRGRIVLIEQSRLSADKAEVVFYIDSDSIYHSGLYFAYHNSNKTVTVNTTDRLTTQSPFYSSYHKINLWVNQITWNIESDELQFGSGLGTVISNAEFESENFFNQELFDRMMGASNFHPVLTIWNYTRKIKSNTFLASDLAVHVHRAPEEVKIEMMRLAKKGYVLYNFETDEVTITKKLKYNVMARFGKTDFDVIHFFSKTDGAKPNARLNLNNLNLLIDGIERISVSDSQNVFISPYKNKITFQKNRNFQFAGNVRAGLFTFYGKSFQFDYSKFKIELNKVDSLLIDYQTNYRDNYGRRILQGVANALHIISGDILIDKPYNKSGREYNPEYPIFNCTSKSYVYYDAPEIYGGVYKRDSFYFEIQPFVYKNMDNFEKADMNFKGILYSGNILAPIEETLRIRPDNSLGFVTKTPSEGMAVYKGKGRVFNKIDLSNKGLNINGSISYITSVTESDSMTLFPDSMITRSSRFTIAKRETGIEFPNVKGGEHQIKWLPKSDKMYVSKGKSPFVMYDSLAVLKGNLLLQPLGLVGDGEVRVPDGKLIAQQFDFSSNAFQTKESSLTIYKTNTDSIALNSDKVKALVNFSTMKTEVARVDKSIFATLDALRYDTYNDRFEWDMKKHVVSFETIFPQEDVVAGKFRVSNMLDADSIPRGSLFYSTKFSEDSLYFFSPKAKYNTTNITLAADSVNYIFTADATVFPYRKKVVVDSKVRMHKLKRAAIKANNYTAYHRFHDAEIRINGRKSYGGSAYYDYIDERDSVQTIFFPKVYSDNNMNTFAEGTLTEPDSFKLSPEFAFIGQVSLSAPEKDLFFKGGAKPIYSCPGTIANWLKFEAQINSKHVLIPVSPKPVNLNLHRLISGTAIAMDSLKLYGGLLRSRKYWEDSALVHAWGYMDFNNKNRRFTIAPLYKLDNPDTTGNSVSLQKDYCWVFEEGNVVLPIDLERIQTKIYGSTIHKLKTNEATINAIIKFDFHFNQKSLEAMANQIGGAITAEQVDLKRKLYRKMLYDWLTPDELPLVLNQISLFGAPTQTPKSLESTITLADVKLKWDAKRKSFVSEGKLGIGTIGNIQVNRYVNGFLEFYKGRNRDWMILHIHLGDNEYYSFYYVNGVMYVNATNPEFYNPIDMQKARERRVKADKRGRSFKYMIGSKRELNRALKRYKEIAFGIKSDAKDNESVDENGSESNDD
jgi:hypothetical protein